MKLLDAVNLVFPKLGERPVTSLDVRHPTLAVLLPIIAQAKKNCLLKGWWFNQYEYNATPNSEGEIVLGDDTLSFVPYYDNVAVVRGEKLFNPVTLLYVFTDAIKGTITQSVEFDELPEAAANYVWYSALVEAYTTDLGVTQELQVWQTLAGIAWSDLVAEHLRQKKYSTRKTKAWMNMRRAMRA